MGPGSSTTQKHAWRCTAPATAGGWRWVTRIDRPETSVDKRHPSIFVRVYSVLSGTPWLLPSLNCTSEQGARQCEHVGTSGAARHVCLHKFDFDDVPCLDVTAAGLGFRLPGFA